MYIVQNLPLTMTVPVSFFLPKVLSRNSKLHVNSILVLQNGTTSVVSKTKEILTMSFLLKTVAFALFPKIRLESVGTIDSILSDVVTFA